MTFTVTTKYTKATPRKLSGTERLTAYSGEAPLTIANGIPIYAAKLISPA